MDLSVADETGKALRTRRRWRGDRRAAAARELEGDLGALAGSLTVQLEPTSAASRELRQHAPILATLLDREEELGWTPMHAAAAQGHTDCIAALGEILRPPAPMASVSLPGCCTRRRTTEPAAAPAAGAGHAGALVALLNLSRPSGRWCARPTLPG